jgi:hypothetical protein
MIVRAALAAASLVAALTTAGCAGAKEPSAPPTPTSADCKLKHPSHDVTSLKDLPAPIRAALKAVAGDMADRGAFFNGGDVLIKPAPFKRFIRGGETGGRWYVWYEHGGIAYWHQVVVFDAATARVVSDVHSNDANLCAMTDLLIYGNQAP